MNELVTKNKNALSVKYESNSGLVELDADTVRRYLVKGNADKVSQQEVDLFIKLCEAFKLNPFVGEAFLIPFEGHGAQMIVGYDAYRRRADENPDYHYLKSGIVVLRGGEVVQKEGACLYPTESLIGGWCRVFRTRGNKEVPFFKEVSLAEYNKGNSMWKSKPGTMIEKVAISQALRAAFPTDYAGTYTPEEYAEPQYDAEATVAEPGKETVSATLDEVISKEERRSLFTKAQNAFGKEDGNRILKSLVEQAGFQTTTAIKKSAYPSIVEQLEELIDEKALDDYEQSTTQTA